MLPRIERNFDINDREAFGIIQTVESRQELIKQTSTVIITTTKGLTATYKGREIDNIKEGEEVRLDGREIERNDSRLIHFSFDPSAHDHRDKLSNKDLEFLSSLEAITGIGLKVNFNGPNSVQDEEAATSNESSSTQENSSAKHSNSTLSKVMNLGRKGRSFTMWTDPDSGETELEITSGFKKNS